MNKKNLTSFLIIGNLIVTLLFLINKFEFVHKFMNTIITVIITPSLFGVFLCYVLKPINKFLIKSGIKKTKSPLITMLSFLIILLITGLFFGNHILKNIYKIKSLESIFIDNENIYKYFQQYFQKEKIEFAINYTVDFLASYIKPLISNIKNLVNSGMMLLANILLVILIAFFLLKDGEKIEGKILHYTPKKYKKIAKEIIGEGDKILSSYIIGQTIIAFSLASIVFIGYLIIDMPSPLVLASITFILAFIPFIGFFLSLIIPYIIALTIGIKTIIKLSVLVIIAQTLKGRIVVPFIMGKKMKIHPLTDIFLVVSAVSLGGVLAAFAIIPIYSIIKMLLAKRFYIEDKYPNKS